MIPESMAGSSEVLLKKLKEARRNYRSQREMAERIGIAPATLNRWFKGKQTPTPDLAELDSIASELEMSPAELVSPDAPAPKSRPPAPTVDGARVKRLLQKAASAIDDVVAALPGDDR